MSLIDEASRLLGESRRILAFTGAGISTESGIPDFRGPNGLWTRVDPDDFNIDRYISDSDLRARSWKMHLEGSLWGARSTVEPNPGHHALKRLADADRLAGVVTQNVDGLHHRSGLAATQVAELHGNVRRSHCVECGAEWDTEEVLGWIEAGDHDPHCPKCGGLVKTNTIMFGELLPGAELDKAMRFLADADSLLVAGSTVAVWPASDVVLRAAFRSMPIVIVNRGETEADHLATVKLDDAIGEVLPEMVDLILGAPPRH